MYNLPERARSIFFYNGSINIGYSFDSLLFRVTKELKRTPIKGEIFVFFNKNRDKVKVFFWAENGWCIIYKRIDRGVFLIEEKDGYKICRGVNPVKLLEDLKIKVKK